MGWFTERPLVVIGATGRLASEMVFYALLERMSPRVILCGGSMSRLQGLKDEIEESGFEGVTVELTTSMTEAVRDGGYILYAKSVPGGAKTREEMLLQNVGYAVECGEALAQASAQVERVICVSNPSDLMGLTLLVHSGMAPERVMSLSSLDTERLRRSLCRRFGVSHEALSDAYTLGSHDQLMAPMLDMVRVKGQSLSALGMTDEEMEALVKEVRRAGISIYKQRGQTAYQSPAVHALRILMATDESPFETPTARYHHSTRYPYTFGSLPTRIDHSGCHHQPLRCGERDLVRLDGAFASIEVMKQRLIEEGYLPHPREWREELQRRVELVEQL